MRHVLSARALALLVLVPIGVASGCNEISIAESEGPAQAVASPELSAPSLAELYAHCPVTPPHRGELRQTIEAGDRKTLEALLGALHDAYLENVSCEPVMWEAFRIAGEELALDHAERWASGEASWIVETLAGARWESEASKRRGKKRSSQVAESEWLGMRGAHERSRVHLKRALELNERTIVPYRWLLTIAQLQGETEQAHALLGQALARDSRSFGVRDKAIRAVSPRWGGSIREISKIAEQAQADADRNPRLIALLGAVDGETARVTATEGKDQIAFEGFERALRFGGIDRWYDWLCYYAYKHDDFEQTVRLADVWLQYDPRSLKGRTFRARALNKLGQHRQAIQELDRVIDEWPNGGQPRRTRASAHRYLGNWERALADLDRALALEPDNEWSARTRQEVLSARGAQPRS